MNKVGIELSLQQTFSFINRPIEEIKEESAKDEKEEQIIENKDKEEDEKQDEIEQTPKPTSEFVIP